MYDSSSDEDNTPKIMVLRGEENFGLWECYVIHVFEMLGLEGFLRGTETPPLGNTPEDMEKLASFRDRKWRAWNLLYESVQSFTARKDIHIRGCGPYNRLDDYDAKVLWDELQRWYTNISPAQKLDFLRELTTIDYRQFDDIDAFLARAEFLQRRLGRLGMPVSDEMKTCMYGCLFAHHPSKILEWLFIVRYDEWDSDNMILEIRKNRFAIQDEANRHQREQQETTRRRNANGQSSGHRGGSRQRGRRR
ncbi:hypothetical protein QBC32DRAFT_152196 [Pseudoneurospora amorphoporcata]|uniref:Uncharacterized protein n=1 Tax=Pseudoneurospora amorphoporcata TaxID=241081 RepID=A0AAN6NTW8_9PEZI|nr:hypothetical protein QBC32DRAFT_152196 [Pseudoneurospora amorphoporcata]